MMTITRVSTFRSSYSSSSRPSNAKQATLSKPKLNLPRLSSPEIRQTTNLLVGLNTTTAQNKTRTRARENCDDRASSSLVMKELYAILETVSDRIEMHANIGQQRDNWNTLLLTSINAIIIGGATMAGLASIGGSETSILALKLSSTLLLSAATGMLVVMNKIQPSQLAEEQRNAVRWFKQLQGQIQTSLAIGTPTSVDVKNAMNKVLALDKAYPLPLLGGVMIEKFPKTVEPAVWWPKQGNQQKHSNATDHAYEMNGWDQGLEDQMRHLIGVLKTKDQREYVKLGKKVLKINKLLAVSGPLLTGISALGCAMVGSPSHGSWASVLAIAGGALASVVNTVEHGGQIGMVFEMYRGCAGSFQLLEESIESTLNVKETERRENGELFEMRVALKLGRSLSELRSLAGDCTQEFASKLS